MDLWNLFSVEASGPKGYRLGTEKEGLDMGWGGRVTEREGATASCVPRKVEGLQPLPVNVLEMSWQTPTDVIYSYRAGLHWSL